MGALVEGLDDFVSAETTRLREQVREGIAKSDYTVDQVATLAGISRGTLYGMLGGTVSSSIDNWARVSFVIGASIEITRPDTEGERPFQVVPLAPINSHSDSLYNQSGSVMNHDLTARGRQKKPKTSTKQGERRSAKRNKIYWSSYLASDQREQDKIAA